MSNWPQSAIVGIFTPTAATLGLEMDSIDSHRCGCTPNLPKKEKQSLLNILIEFNSWETPEVPPPTANSAIRPILVWVCVVTRPVADHHHQIAFSKNDKVRWITLVEAER